jgi:hypothetical protein
VHGRHPWWMFQLKWGICPSGWRFVINGTSLFSIVQE